MNLLTRPVTWNFYLFKGATPKWSGIEVLIINLKTHTSHSLTPWSAHPSSLLQKRNFRPSVIGLEDMSIVTGDESISVHPLYTNNLRSEAGLLAMRPIGKHITKGHLAKVQQIHQYFLQYQIFLLTSPPNHSRPQIYFDQHFKTPISWTSPILTNGTILPHTPHHPINTPPPSTSVI